MDKFNKCDRDITAIIFTGGRDFGRCPLASRLPSVLWPVAGRPVLEHLLHRLSDQGVKRVVVCSNGSAFLLRGAISDVDSMQISFLDELLPVGTAGCIREAAGGDAESLFIALHGTTLLLPPVDTLIQAHQNNKSDLTVILSKDNRNGNLRWHSGEIYICEPTVLECIPKQGYFDIKEGLIPAMLRAGRTVRAVKSSWNIGNFRDSDGYLTAISQYIECRGGAVGFKRKDSGAVWLADSAVVSEDARIYGGVIIMDGAVVSKEAVILGPTIVGRDVVIGEKCFVENSVLWDRVSVGENCEIHRCTVDYDTVVPKFSILEDKAIPQKHNIRLYYGINKAASIIDNKVKQLTFVLQKLSDGVMSRLPRWAKSERLGIPLFYIIWAGILVGAFMWSYWPGISDLWDVWQRSDEYSSGLLVPFLAIYVLWARREGIDWSEARPSIWGLFGLLGAQGVRYFGLLFMYSSAERLSLVLSISSLVLFLFGWQVFRKLWAVLLFLCLMLPLPQSIHFRVMLPLQSLATTAAVFCLETMGYAVVREGNIININGNMVAVSEACNGLRMVTSFFIIAGLVVLLIRRPWWEKLIVLVSSLPVALLCNVVRLTITAVAFTILSGDRLKVLFHDFGGYAMMPLALGVVILELWFLARLTTVRKEQTRRIIFRRHHN